MTRLDSLGMYEAALALPEQVANAAISVAGGVDGLPAREKVAHVLALGHGWQRHRRRRDVCHRRPVRARPDPRVEGLRAARLRRGADPRLRDLVLGQLGGDRRGRDASGGAAARTSSPCAREASWPSLAEQWGGTVLRVPAGIPMPRAGIGAFVDPSAACARADGVVPRSGGLDQRRCRPARAPP